MSQLDRLLRRVDEWLNNGSAPVLPWSNTVDLGPGLSMAPSVNGGPMRLTASGGSGSGGGVFVYRDSEPSPSGNVFATWATAYAAAHAAKGFRVIEIDASLNPCATTAGSYDLSEIRLRGRLNATGDIPPLTLVEGTSFGATLEDVETLNLIAANTTTPIVSGIGATTSGQLDTILRTANIQGSGSAPFAQAHAFAVWKVIADDVSSIGGTGACDVDSGSIVFLYLSSQSTAADGSFTGVVGAQLIANFDASSIMGTQAGFLGTVERNPQDDASRIANVPPAQGLRLTLTTGVGYPADNASAGSPGTLFLTPYVSNSITLFDGNTWRTVRTAEISLSLAAVVSGKNYDVFAIVNPSTGAVTLELSAAWATDTTRTDALIVEAASGVLVKSADHTRRYLGTIRASGAGASRDDYINRFVWNYYNRQPRGIARAGLATSITTATNASLVGAVAYVCGDTTGFEAEVRAYVIAASTALAKVRVFGVPANQGTVDAELTLDEVTLVTLASFAVASSNDNSTIGFVQFTGRGESDGTHNVTFTNPNLVGHVSG